MKPMHFATAAFIIAAIACDDDGDAAPECRMITEKVSLTGTVIYDDYQEGRIDLFIDETTSEVCDDDGDETFISPGDRVGTLLLEGPGPFETEVEISHVEGSPPPGLNVSAYQNFAPGSHGPVCEAGGTTVVSSKNPPAIELNLETGYCPLFL